MLNGKQLSKTQQLRLEQERMIECIKAGWSREEIMKFWNWNATKYKSLFLLVREEIKDYINELPEGDDGGLGEAIMRTFYHASENKHVKEWTDPRTGKKWADVTDFFT